MADASDLGFQGSVACLIAAAAAALAHSDNRKTKEHAAEAGEIRTLAARLIAQQEQWNASLDQFLLESRIDLHKLTAEQQHSPLVKFAVMLSGHHDDIQQTLRDSQNLHTSLLRETMSQLEKALQPSDFQQLRQIAADIREIKTSTQSIPGMATNVEESLRLLRERQQLDRQQTHGASVHFALSPDHIEVETAIRRTVIAAKKMVRLIGIPGAQNVSQVPLDDVFVAPLLQVRDEMADRLKASDDSTERSPAETTRSSESKASAPAAGEPLSLDAVIRRSRRLVIVGAPGSGKTTIATYLALLLAKGEGGSLHSELSAEHFPIVVTVRKLDAGFRSLPRPIQLLEACVPALTGTIDAAHARHALSTGKAVLIIDGLDECELPVGDSSTESIESGEPTEWNLLMQWLRELSETFPRLRIIATSRPVGYNRQGRMPGMDHFDTYKIRMLSAAQQSKYIENWCKALANVERRLSGQEPALASDTAGHLLNHIQKSPALKALAHTPITLSVLCLLQAQGQLTTRERLAGVLKKCVDALLYEFRNAVQVTEGIRPDLALAGRLDAQSQRALLEPIAFHMKRAGIREIGRDIVLGIIASRLPLVGYDAADAAVVLQSMRDRGGVFVEGSPARFEWTHELFMELLAGHDCAARHDLEVLRENAGDPAWREVIPFALSEMRASQQVFIASCLESQHVEMAVRVMRESVVVASDLRAKVLDQAASLVAAKPAAGLSALVELNDRGAAARFLGAVLQLVPLSSDEAFSVFGGAFARDKLRYDVQLVARRAALRCHYNDSLMISKQFGGTQCVTYDSVPDSDNSASWAYCSFIAVADHDKFISQLPMPTLSGEWRDNPIYNLAVMLDTLDGPNSFDDNVIQDGLLTAFQQQPAMRHEHRLIALIVAHYALASRDRHFVGILLDCLERLPSDVGPASQLGMLNACVKRWDAQLLDGERRRAFDHWRRCVVQIELMIKRLVDSWSEGYVGPNDAGETLSPVDRISVFETEFRRELARHSPFAFDSNALKAALQ